MKPTQHAVIRFRERVRPTLGFDECRDELARLLAASPLVAEPPSWASNAAAGKADRWVVLTEDIACPVLSDGTVPTVLIRDLIPDRHRDRLNRRKAARRAARQYRNKAFAKRRLAKDRERPRARIEDEAWPV